MTGCRQQKPKIGLTKCPDLVDHYTSGLHQQAVLGQYPKQPVMPYLEPAILLTLQQIMQLASAHPRLSQSNLTHKAHHLQPLCMALVGDPIALVVSLPAYPQKQASPDNGQPFDLPLREDLPGRFFTMETP